MAGLLDRALALSGYHEKRARFDGRSFRAHAQKGIGFARPSCTARASPDRAEDHLASIVERRSDAPAAVSAC